MRNAVLRKCTVAAALGSVLVLAGCAATESGKTPNKTTRQCAAAQPNDPAVGTWLSHFRRKGVAGEFRLLFVLEPNGTMDYAEQVKRSGKPAQGLRESGCWHREGNTLVLQTTKSNGLQVEPNDPIYTNRYTVVSQSGDKLSLKGGDGAIRARRMSPGYRLPAY